ncbi:class I SAM-dependent methyltransferase, partial [Thiofilum flexile]|uniref:class I SAM-dependent methyltransferase n=1 Tax=Thiofilum flexile TaxID=125627 RepID=UPI0013A555E4
MEFTGERYIPTEQGKIRLEHYHRYAIILEFLTNKCVLDIASGEGYGSAMMAQTAKSVVGVDIDSEAISHATNTYQNVNNLTFLQGDVTAIPAKNESFDIVVSFETIEHLIEQYEMLTEIKRVLRKDGVLIISSPNRPIYSEESGEHNKFHLKELDFYEFNQLLKGQFSQVQYYGQKMMIGSTIQSIENRTSTYQTWHDDGINIKTGSTLIQKPVYFLAVCGSNNATLPLLNASIIYPDKLDLVEHYVGFAKWAQAVDKTIIERDKQIIEYNNTINANNQQIDSLNQIVEERD